MKRRWRRAALILLGIPALPALAFVALDRAFPFPLERLEQAQHGGAVQVLDARGGRVGWRVDAQETWRLPVTRADFHPWLVQATLAAEDKRFHRHAGVDPRALLRAVWQNVRHRRRVSGASTLTMQTVRLMTPRPRTWTSKAIEAFRALQLERLLDKDAILTAYLNLAPYGGNVVGAEAAARRHYGCSARRLTLGQAALLAGLPQRPAVFNPRRDPEAARARRPRWRR